MSITCPNCGHIRTSEDDAVTPKWKCPKCDIVYSKFNPQSDENNKTSDKLASQKASTKTSLNSTKSSQEGNNKKYIFPVIVLAAFMLGYFAGREHIKYEMRQAMTEAANQFKQGMSEIFSPSKKESSAPRESQESEGKSLGVKLIRKGYRDFDVDIGNKAVTFTLEFTNTIGRDLRAFDGLLVISDLLDNPIKKLNISYTKPISANETVSWNGEMDYNQFIDSDRSLRSKELSDLKVKLILRKVLYSDGTTEEY